MIALTKEFRRYVRDRVVQKAYSCILNPQGRAKTSMQIALLGLELKGHLPKDLRALEMFGMHGLWHTMDYVHKVAHLDILEINENYHRLSKLNLKEYPVRFIHTDALQWIKESGERYNFIVADTPSHTPRFYDDSELPVFLPELVRLLTSNSVLIFNVHSTVLSRSDEFQNLVIDKLNELKVAVIELFFVPRSSNVSYCVVVARKE